MRIFEKQTFSYCDEENNIKTSETLIKIPLNSIDAEDINESELNFIIDQNGKLITNRENILKLYIISKYENNDFTLYTTSNKKVENNYITEQKEYNLGSIHTIRIANQKFLKYLKYLAKTF